MKDLSRKVRNWDNDNYIMKNHGKSIRKNIARSLVKAQTSIAVYRTIDLLQRKALESIPKDKWFQA